MSKVNDPSIGNIILLDKSVTGKEAVKAVVGAVFTKEDAEKYGYEDKHIQCYSLSSGQKYDISSGWSIVENPTEEEVMMAAAVLDEETM